MSKSGVFKEIFSCPVCSAQLELSNEKSLICINNHCFDLAKEGYVNLLSRAYKTKYDKDMFAARKIICQRGFYEKLHTAIADTIMKNIGGKDSLKILDAGCGEGSHLAGVMDRLDSMNKPNSLDLLGVGMDISKEAVKMAAKEYARTYDNTLWCVGDIGRCPFEAGTFDTILNILSPSNYSEFNRLLHEEGSVIKVIPEKDYLRELREVLYGNKKQQDYSNHETLELFTAGLELLDSKNIRYTVSLEPPLIESLIQMTPLSWGAGGDSFQKALASGLSECTVDLTILTGKKKS